MHLNFAWPQTSMTKIVSQNKRNELNQKDQTFKNHCSYDRTNELINPQNKIQQNPARLSEKQQKLHKEKEHLLIQLKNKIEQEKRILFSTQAINLVFSDGNYNAPLMFIGEAPGEEEDIKGIPFIGKSGQLLRQFLKGAKIKNFYITNIIPWRPPNNRTPTNEEINIMQPYILEHISIIQPEIIIPVGTTALKTLNISETITNTQGTFIHSIFGLIYPIYHPSYALRIITKKKELWISLLKLAQHISKNDCNINN